MKIIADINIPFVKECFSYLGEVILVSGRDITPQLVKDADALLVRSITKVDKDLLAGSSVKFVATATIGVDHIDIDYLNNAGIGFASAPGSNANSVAEYIVAAMLQTSLQHGLKIENSSLGIIGVGNVGSKVEQKALALGMRVILNDPPLERTTYLTKYRPLEDLYDCDFITIHTPLTRQGEDATYHLANEHFFANLKAGAVFMNSSRGAVTDTNALKNAIKSNKIKSCVLDVWEKEPNIDTELLEMTDIASPHIAGYSYDGKIAGMIMVYEALCRHFGLEIVKKQEDFLPEPIVKQIDMTGVGGDEESIIRACVERVYDILEDDCLTRKQAKLPADEQGKYFDSLRKNYPIRREFQNTLVVGAPARAAQKLAGIGFKIQD